MFEKQNNPDRVKRADELRKHILELEGEIARLSAELRAILLAHQGPKN
jgi:hypothetical protein